MNKNLKVLAAGLWKTLVAGFRFAAVAVIIYLVFRDIVAQYGLPPASFYNCCLLTLLLEAVGYVLRGKVGFYFDSEDQPK